MLKDDQSRLKYMDVLLEITQAIQQSEALDEALTYAVQAVARLINVATGTIWYYDQYNSQRIIPVYVLNQSGSLDFTLAPGEGIAGSVIQNGRSEIVLDCASDPRWLRRADDETGFVTRNMICVPLNSKDATLGCIQLINKLGSETFSKDDLALCETLASIAAIAIDEKGLIIKPAAQSRPLVALKNLERTFVTGKKANTVLKEVTVDIYENEFVVILGASGSGKSTLLKIIGGMDQPTSGSIVVQDMSLMDASEAQLARYRRNEVGFVFQSYYLLPNLTAKQNLEIIAELAEDPLSADEVLEMVAMVSRAKNYPSQLSGGQQQRISIGRAVIKRPKLILADEPTAALDFNTSLDVLEVFENIIKNRMSTVVLITHNAEIAKMADRVIRISDGTITEVTVNMNPHSARSLKW